MPSNIRKICALALCLLWWAGAAWAGGITAQGRVLAANGAPVARALLSDGMEVTLTDSSGHFSLPTARGRVVWVCAPPGMRPVGRWYWPADTLGGPLTIRLRTYQPRPQAGVVLLSDPHLYAKNAPTAGPPPAPQIRPMEAWRVLGQTLRDAAPALTVVAGDICFDADKGPRSRARSQLNLAAQAMTMLPAPARALPGNHDLDPGGGLSGWRQKLGPSRHVFMLPDMAVMLLDWDLASHSAAWALRAAKMLPPQLPLILVSHKPILGSVAWPNPGPGAGLVAQLMRSRPLLAVVHGHWHAGYQSKLELTQGSLWVWGLPAVCGGWWRGPRRWGKLSFTAGMGLARLGKKGLVIKPVTLTITPGKGPGPLSGQ